MTGLIFSASMVFSLACTVRRADCRVTGASMLDEMRRIEFTEIDYNEEADPYYGYIKGVIPILISAPHGAKHYRAAEGVLRGEDAYTASLAIVLGRLTSAHVLYVKNKTGEDPNNDAVTKYKEALKGIVKESHIKFVLDLHGSGGHRPFKVDIGIMDSEPSRCSCPTFVGTLEKVFRDFERNIFNRSFSAGGPGTITSFASNTLGIEAAQVEINANYRIVESKSGTFRADPENVLALMERLRAAVEAVNEKIGQSPSRSLP